MVQVIIRNININQVGKTYQAIELIQNTGVDRDNTQKYIRKMTIDLNRPENGGI